ncbi:MAG: DNA polymerase III subunit chi [Pseudomonadota bacterium]
MAEAVFYHLTRRPLEEALPDLLLRTLERGWRAVVRCGSEARAEDLNRRLWTFRDEAFLPHGGPGDGRPERQPIYLTAGSETPNAPDLLFLVDGAAAAPEEAARFTRVCLMFDGRDAAATAGARSAWKAMVEAGIPAIYWAQSDQGRWEKKAEKRPDDPA